jgi:D-amino-acid dehydrogenase
MHVIVLGAGVVGMTTAYYLAARGCEVTVIDQAREVGCGASFANGGQLSYSFTDSLARPGFITRIPALLAGRDIGSRAELSTGLAAWGMRFLAQCTSRRAAENTLELLSIAMRSARLIADARHALPFDFSYRAAGKLVLLTSAEELRAARATTALKQAHGSDVEMISRAEAVAVEPTLEQFAKMLYGAVYSASDEVADALLFCRGLQAYLAESGAVQFQLGSRVEQLYIRNKSPVVALANGEQRADAVVVCLGANSPALLAPLGIHLHIYPVRGYSVTLPPGSAAPSVSVTALADRIVFSRMNGRMRIAGFADFNGFADSKDRQRIDELLAVARRVAPGAADYSHADCSGWGGFRPMTPSGLPYTGPTRIPGLHVNTGHGMLGWTLACASAHDTAQSVMANQSAVIR